MGEFNSDDHYIYYCGQESLRRNGLAIIVNKRVNKKEMQYLDAISKTTEWSVCFQSKPFNITVIQVYAPTSNAEDAEVERFYEDRQDLLELITKIDVLFIRKSRNTWRNRQIWLWSTEWSRAKANRVLPTELTAHSKHPLPTVHEKALHMDITKCSIPKSDWLYSLQTKVEKLYTVSKNKTASWLWLRTWTPYWQIQT